MKKLFRILSIVFISMLCVPIFSACDSNISAELKQIVFAKDVYEVDVQTPIKLEYKVFPTTALNYVPEFEFDVHQSKYVLDENDMFTLRDPECKEITAKIKYGIGENDFDTCKIVQKEYPTQIYFQHSTDYINKGSAYNLVLKAKMADGTIKNIDRSSYDIVLSSDAPHVVSVTENGLVAVSTGQSGKATITANIKNLSGNMVWIEDQKLEATLNLNVVEYVDHAVVALSQSPSFIKTSTTRQQTADNTFVTTLSNFNLQVKLYSANNLEVSHSNINFGLALSATDSRIIKNINNLGNGTFSFSIDYNLAQSYKNKEDRTICVEITSNAIDQNGNPKNFVFYIEIYQAEE